jgi:urea carboxylase
VLYEVGPMELDIQNRVQVELWERAMLAANTPGIINFNTCIRSCLVQFDPRVISMTALLKIMIETDAGLTGAEDVSLDIHVIRLPVVVDDKWCQEAVDYYMRTSRDEAVYLPNNTVRATVVFAIWGADSARSITWGGTTGETKRWCLRP